MESELVVDRRRRQAKLESVSVSAAMLIVLAAGIFGLLGTAQTSAYQGYRHYLMGLAKAAATMVDPVLHNKIRRPEQLNDADYVRAVAPLRRLRLAVPDVHYVYTFTLDGSDVRFVLDAADPGAKSVGGGSDQSGVWEIYQHRSPEMMLSLGNGRGPGVAAATSAQVTDEWGTFMTGFAPLFDASGHQIGAVGVDVDATVFLARAQAARNRALLGLVPAGVLIALLGWVFYRVRLRSLADVAAREAMEAALIEAAQQDKLTGLPNREAFMERLEQTLLRVRAGRQLQFAVLFLDFDRFKLINDTLGHEAGDELLRQISRRLQSTLRTGEAGIASQNEVLISRFGGDEFLVLIDDLQGARNVVRVSEHLLEALAPAYSVFASEVHSMASVGIVIGDPVCSNSTADEIVRNADVAMYEAKRSGRGCSVVFNAGMHARLTRHVAIETSLRRALGGDELYLE
ncbi:MAG TPA: GGDEF domain-containing protein, partial [Steroidobacteraceae bacterium]